MSAYVVDVKTIERILDWIGQDARTGLPRAYSTVMGSKVAPFIFTAELGYDLDTDEGLQTLGDALLNMNRDAVGQRYPNDGPDDMPGPIEPQTLRYRNGRIPPDIYQAHASMSGLVYQCAEGDIVDRPLYQALVTYKRRIAEAFLTSRDKYQDTTWG